jgi:hypothetical protein
VYHKKTSRSSDWSDYLALVSAIPRRQPVLLIENGKASLDAKIEPQVDSEPDSATLAIPPPRHS